MNKRSLAILLIEDSQTDALLLKTFLSAVSEIDFNVETVSSLKDAALSIAKSSHDAVILDLGLPDSFGLSTYSTIRGLVPSKPIIIMSGNEDRSLIAEAMASGADNYLIKDSVDGNRIAIAILSSIRNKMAS